MWVISNAHQKGRLEAYPSVEVPLFLLSRGLPVRRGVLWMTLGAIFMTNDVSSSEKPVYNGEFHTETTRRACAPMYNQS